MGNTFASNLAFASTLCSPSDQTRDVFKQQKGAETDDTASTASGAESERADLNASGELVYYDEGQSLPVLEVGDVNTGPRALVCVTSNGLSSIEYLPALAEAAKYHGFWTIQPVRAGVADLGAVLSHLEKQRGIKDVVLFGLMSNCRDILHFMQQNGQASMISGIILQGAESDGEGNTDKVPSDYTGCFSVPTLLVTSSEEELSHCLANPMLGDAEVVSLTGLSKGVEGSQCPQTAKICASAGAFLRRAAGVAPAPVVLSWECEAAQRIRALRSSTPAGRPVMVGLVGIPGSGKSTSAKMIAELLGERAALIPMDGYHQTKAQLAARPDAQDATYRRGAPDTFDPEALKEALSHVVDPDGPEEVLFPGFDHAVGDPIHNEHRFSRAQHDFAIVEGIYLLHDKHGFEGTHEFFDLTVYLERDIDQAVAQLKIRNKCIPGYTPEEIDVRCEVVDRKNAETVQLSRRRSSLQITPLEY